MATITPFVKRMRAQGGTIYTFSSALEDIGLNINERNNIVKMSHYALLNIPSIDAPVDPSVQNRFNVFAIPGAFQSFLSSGSIKDGRVIVAESFQNYALNLETNLLARSEYNPALSTTVSERVFWKWLKETGAIRWTDVSTSAGSYWQEETDMDVSVGYNSVVKGIGQISAGSVRTDTFGTYNETYVLVPTSFGQTPVYFKQVEDDNYKHGLSFTQGLTNIYGRNPYLKPHPDGLDIQAYYDLPDSSVSVGSYTMNYDDSTGVMTPGWWWSTPYSLAEFNLSDDRDYFIDTNNYIGSKIYNIDLKYDGPNDIQFRRSKVDCLSIEYDLNKLKEVFDDVNPAVDHYGLTFDQMAINYATDDSYQFNAILLYYSVYNEALDTTLATNLLGILFLDPPSGNTQNYPLNEIILPSITKLQSGPNGFGTSYSFRLNIKSDYMLDDTQAIVTDTTASQQVLEDFSQVFDSLGKTLGILNQQTGTLSYITEQYLDITANQTNMMNQLDSLQQEVNNIEIGIQGTENALAMFASGDDPLIDSSIYMKNGNIGVFNDNPSYPAQIDKTLKTKDIIIENSIKDTSGNIILGYGSPLTLGSTTNFREVDIYTGNATPAIHIDASNNVSFNNVSLGTFINESSLGAGFVWNGGILDVSTAGGSGISFVDMKNYVDPSLLVRDTRIDLRLKEASINIVSGGFAWSAGQLIVNVSSGTGGITESQMKAYVDPSLAARDVVINTKITSSDLAPYATTFALGQAVLPYATNASIGAAGFAKTTDLANYVAKAGDTMSGNLILNGNLTSNGGAVDLNGAHAVVASVSNTTCTGPGIVISGLSITLTPKGDKIFITATVPIHNTVGNQQYHMSILSGANPAFTFGTGTINMEVAHFIATTVAMNTLSTIIFCTPGVPITVKIGFRGTTAVRYFASDAYGLAQLSVIDLY
jgi:hypothetical protein